MNLKKLIIIYAEDEIDINKKIINQDKTNTIPKMLKDAIINLPLYIDLTWATNENDKVLENLKYKEIINSISNRFNVKTPYKMNSVKIKTTKRNIRIRNITITVMFVLLVLSVSTSIYAIIQRNEALNQTNKTFKTKKLQSIRQY